MSDLNSLLDQLTSQYVDDRKNSKISSKTMNNEIEGLLDSLTQPSYEHAPQKKQPQHKQQISSQLNLQPSDDLDSLLSDLTVGNNNNNYYDINDEEGWEEVIEEEFHEGNGSDIGAMDPSRDSTIMDDVFFDELIAEVGNSAPPQEVEDEDVDALISDLNGVPPPARQPDRSRLSAYEQSEIESIMAEIGGADDTETLPTSGGIDLEEFLGQLEESPNKQSKPATKTKSTSTPSKPKPQSHPTPGNLKSKPSVRASPLTQDLQSLVSDLTSADSELDSLVSDFENNQLQPQSPKQPQNQASDLEALISDLDTHSGKVSRPTTSRVPPSDRRTMNSDKYTSGVPNSNDLNDINYQLNQPVRGTPNSVNPTRTGNVGRGGGRAGPIGATPPASSGKPINPGSVNRGAGNVGRGGNPGNSGGGDLDNILSGLNEPTETIKAGRGGSQRVQEKLPKGICSGCRKPVTGEAVHASGRSYHPDHFMCSTCGKPIGNGSYYEKEGQPQCDRCYQAVFCKRCSNCNLPITNQLVTALGQPWHPKCFVCTDCGCSFSNGQFYEKDGRPFCNNCFYKVFSPACHKCNTSIDTAPINALGGSWHPECFTCTSCGVSFPDGQFYELDGNPYCESDYRELVDGGY